MDQTKPRTIEEAIKVLENEYPHGVELIYIDYRDSFDESKDNLNRAIQANDLSQVWDDEPMDWFGDAEYETIEYILKDKFTSEELENWDGDEQQQLHDWLFEHDTSKPAEELLKNTGNKLFFYDTGLEIPEYPSSGDGDKFLAKHAKRIAKKLEINYETHAKTLRSLIANACYGGQLVLIFYCQPKDLFSPDKDNVIRFKDKAHLCIMDRTQGSGDQEDINETIVLPFNRENLWIDSAAGGYSIDSVFGFYLPAFEQTPDLLTIKKTRKPAATKLQNEKKIYDAWDADLKKGICHFQDPRFKSHDTEYRNDYPCGNKCKRCGRFFVD